MSVILSRRLALAFGGASAIAKALGDQAHAETEIRLAEERLSGLEAARARSSLEAFIHYTDPDYRFGWFNRLVCAKLEQFLAAVERGEAPRLMLFAPPRHGKTQIVSRAFPAYAFGRNPNIRFIGTSYGASLASHINLDIQRIIDSDPYKRVFPQTRLAGSLRDGWLRNGDVFEIVGHKGTYRNAGVSGPITGRGGDILTIDDPVKDAEEASSLTIRDKVWDWYVSTLYPRKEPGAGILLVMTRWHQDDLAGRLLKAAAAEGDKWEVVSFPAIAEAEEAHRERGEALHPERFPLQVLSAIRGVVGPYQWASLYQQRPAPREGGMFRRQWFSVVPAAPARVVRRVRAWDLAATQPKGSSDPDWTVGLRMSKDNDGVFYIEDARRMRETPNNVERAILNTATSDGRLTHVRLSEDPGQAGKAQVLYLTQKLAGYTVRSMKETGSKETRATAFASQCEAGNVKLVDGPWIEPFLAELEMFPTGTHDDQVDAATNAFNQLAVGGPNYDSSMSWVGDDEQVDINFRDARPDYRGSFRGRDG